MSHDLEPSILREASQILDKYGQRWRHAMDQLETHDFRIKQSPLTIDVPSITHNDEEIVMRLRIRRDVSESQIMDLVQGIEMPIEFIAGE